MTQGGLLRRMILLVVLCVATVLLLTSIALARETSMNRSHADKEAASLNCSDFATQRGAQALLKKGDPFELDKDGDGRACEIQKNRVAEDGTKLGADTGGDLDCIDFPTQRAAQAHLRANPSDKSKLDLDNNGIACEIVPVPYKDQASDRKPVTRAQSSADLDCEDFEYQQEAQMIYFRNESDPNELDKNGNGLACEDELPALASNRTPVYASQPSDETGELNLWLPFAGGLILSSATLGFASWRRSRT